VLDVAPFVYLETADRGAACAAALITADMLGDELELPVFLYGELARGRTRADLRRGGPTELKARIDAGALAPDFGPKVLDPSKGAVLVAARPPLVAFNVELGVPATLEQARQIAAEIRESGPAGLEGVRAIGLWLAQSGRAQVSTNIEDHHATPLRVVVEAIAQHATPVGAELVGLAPRAAFDGFPEDLPVRNRRVIEDALENRK
jgi:glutamate formiminotransferase